MTNLRCLWLTRVLPYPPSYGGDVIYSSHLIEALAANDARVTVLCHDNGSWPSVDPNISWHVLRPGAKAAWASLLGPTPSIVHRSRSQAIERRFAELLHGSPWDAVILDNLATAWALGAVSGVMSGPAQPALVYLSHNHEASLRREVAGSYRGNPAKRIALQIDARKAARLERQLVQAADILTANTPEDRELFNRDFPEKPCVVLTPGYDGPVLSGRNIAAELPRLAVIVGSFGWLAKQMNLVAFLSAAAQAFEAAGARIEVVGSMPPAFLASLRRRFPSVGFRASVDDVTSSLRGARLALIPEAIGGGFKHKVLEFAFNRVPMATLPGCLAGTPLADGESVAEFADLGSLAEGALRMLDDLPLLDRLQEAAFRACEGRFDWADRGTVLASAIEAAAGDRRARPQRIRA